MRKTVYIFTLCIAAILTIPQLIYAQDSRARVEEVLSYFPAGLYSNFAYYDFEAIRLAPSYDLYKKHFDWKKMEARTLAPLPKELNADVSSLAEAIRVRFRISNVYVEDSGTLRPEILLDENGNYSEDPNVTSQTFTSYGHREVAIVNFGRTFRVYRIIGLNDQIKKAVKSGSMVLEDGSILGVPFYRIEENPLGVPLLCCSAEPDVLLIAEDRSMLEELVAVSSGAESSLVTEDLYNEVIFLGPELGQHWWLSNSSMTTHRSIVRRLVDFGIPEEFVQERVEKDYDGQHFFINTYIIGGDIIERELFICGSEEYAQKLLDYRSQGKRYGVGDDNPDVVKRFYNAYNAAWKFSREGGIVTSDVKYDEDLLTLKDESDKAIKELRENLAKEKEAGTAKKKANAEKK